MHRADLAVTQHGRARLLVATLHCAALCLLVKWQRAVYIRISNLDLDGETLFIPLMAC